MNTTRRAIISDIHANVDALQAVLADIEGQAVDEVWCLGDVVGVGPSPAECLEIVRARCAVVLMGNHELGALGRYGGATHVTVPMIVDSDRFTREALGDAERAYIEALPERARRGGWLLVHDLTAGHLTPPEASRPGGGRSAPTAEDFASAGGARVLTGHSHVPTAHRLVAPDAPVLALDPSEPVLVDHTPLIADPGSVGYSRAGTPDATYFVLDAEDAEVVGAEHVRTADPAGGCIGGTGTLSLRTVAYDVRAVLERAYAAGAPQRLQLVWQARVGQAEQLRGALEAAHAAYLACLSGHLELGYRPGILTALGDLAGLHLAAGEPERALRLAAAVDAAARESGATSPTVLLLKRLAACLERARAALGPRADAAQTAGERLSLGEAVALASAGAVPV